MLLTVGSKCKCESEMCMLCFQLYLFIQWFLITESKKWNGVSFLKLH